MVLLIMTQKSRNRKKEEGLVMTMGYVGFSWELYAKKVVKEEIGFLMAMNSSLPPVTILFIEGIQKGEKEKGDGSVISGISCGKYMVKDRVIIIYFDSIAEVVGYDTNKFEEKLKATLAHEYQHHCQLTGSNSNHYKKSLIRDVENNVDYFNREIEVDARAAGDWYLERRKPISIQL